MIFDASEQYGDAMVWRYEASVINRTSVINIFKILHTKIEETTAHNFSLS